MKEILQRKMFDLLLHGVIKNFVGLPHRGSIIKNNNKFIAINNSKATNVDSAYKSIQNQEHTIKKLLKFSPE